MSALVEVSGVVRFRKRTGDTIERIEHGLVPFTVRADTPEDEIQEIAEVRVRKLVGLDLSWISTGGEFVVSGRAS